MFKTEVTKLPQSEIEITVEIDPQEWGEFISRAAEEFSKNIKIEGFRPGRAPFNLVEQKVGLGKILEKAADAAVKKTYVKIILEKNIEAIGRPEIQVLKIAKDNPFEFKAKVAIMPEVALGDYQTIAKSIPQKPADEIKVEEKEIEEALKWLQKSRVKYAAVAREAKTGDRVEIDFIAGRGGQIIEGGENKNQPVILGEGRFIPGFEENIAGLREGEEKKFTLPFPNDFPDENLRGEKIDFEIKVNTVQEAQLPPINDEFAASIGKFQNSTALKQSVKDGLTQEKILKEKEKWQAEILTAIAAESSMEIPPVLLESENHKMLHELEDNLAQMGITLDTYLSDIKKTKEDLERDWSGKAKERVRAALVLRQIAQKEAIVIDDKELEEEVAKIISHYPEKDAAENKIDINRLKEYTIGRLKNEKVFQLLASHNNKNALASS